MSLAPAIAASEHDTLDGITPPAATLRLYGHAGPFRELVEAKASGRMHHAWLLQGPRGIGKATAAFAFARHLLGCTPADPAAPDASSSAPNDPVARQIAQGSHPGLIHLTRPVAERGTGFRPQVTVEEVRRLNRFFRTTTGGGGWRIAIVDPADDLNRNAANALLKILEEPPERSVFLITNHLPGRLLPTIRSRCRVLRFEALSPELVEETIAAVAPDFAPSQIKAAARVAEGSVRTAILMIAGGGTDIETHLEALWIASQPDWNAIQTLADIVTQKGRETAFDLLAASFFSRLSADAAAFAAAGNLMAARRHADLWACESERFRNGLAFNLDRKQLLLTAFAKLFALRTPAGDRD